MRVVVAGGGFAAAEAVIALHELAGDRVEVELVSSTPELLYRPHAVTAPFTAGDIRRVPLAPLCEQHGATLRLGALTAVDVPGHRIHTDATPPIGYEALLVAVGARRRPALRDAMTFDGRRGIAELRRLLDGLTAGSVQRVAFVVPDGVTWPLPLYELALQTSLLVPGADLAVVTAEPEPLELFGSDVSARVRTLLEERRIELLPLERLRRFRADRIVALPRIEGPRLHGLPADHAGFIPVDEHGRVDGTASVWAAGDATNAPVKQGGLAAQQASAAAEAIAARAGAPIDPHPFRPFLRAVLLTGGLPLWLGAGGAFQHRPWPQPGKVVGARLSKWLNEPDPATAPQTVDAAFALAEETARAGRPGEALNWLDAVEALVGRLPDEYAAKRREWTLTTPDC